MAWQVGAGSDTGACWATGMRLRLAGRSAALSLDVGFRHPWGASRALYAAGFGGMLKYRWYLGVRRASLEGVADYVPALLADAHF